MQAIWRAPSYLAIMHAMGRDLARAAGQLNSFVGADGRMQHLLLTMESGKRIQLIDDSWNATFVSMLNAFDVLAHTRPQHGGRRIAVFGRIVHLGDAAQKVHEELAKPLLGSGVEKVVTHGREMQYLRAKIPPELLGAHFADATELVVYLRRHLRHNDVVLVKGSRRDSDFGGISRQLREQSEIAPILR